MPVTRTGDFRGKEDIILTTTAILRLCSDKWRTKPIIPYRKLPRVNRWKYTARHNPHPRLVNHFYDILNNPVCNVVDPPLMKEMKYLDPLLDKDSVTVPINTLTGLPILRLRSIPIKERAIPQLGIIPIQENWRRELKALTESIIEPLSEEIGMKSNSYENLMEYHPYPICRPITSVFQRAKIHQMKQDYILFQREKFKSSTPKFPPIKTFCPDKLVWDDTQNDDYESQVFALLGQILQTTDVNDIKFWLTAATDREKATAMGILQAAIESKLRVEKIEEEDKSSKDSSLNIQGETEVRNENVDRLIIEFDKRASTSISRPKSIASKIRPQTACNSIVDPDSQIKSKSQTAPIILRYKTASKARSESARMYSIEEENDILE